MATVAVLAAHVAQVSALDSADPAWGAHLLPAILALPPGDYNLLDPETDQEQLEDLGLDPYELVPAALEVTKLAEWSGPPSYGDLARITTANGVGLDFSFGGSPMNSAFGVWVLPVADLPANYPPLEQLYSFTIQE